MSKSALILALGLAAGGLATVRAEVLLGNESGETGPLESPVNTADAPDPSQSGSPAALTGTPVAPGPAIAPAVPLTGIGTLSPGTVGTTSVGTSAPAAPTPLPGTPGIGVGFGSLAPGSAAPPPLTPGFGIPATGGVFGIGT